MDRPLDPFLAQAQDFGVSPRSVLATILEPEWNARRFRNTREGQQLRELGAAAQVALAIFQDNAEKVLLRLHAPDPPDVSIWNSGELFGYFDVVDVLAADARPNAEEIDLERRTQIVADTQSEPEMLAAIERLLLGQATCRTMKEVRKEAEEAFAALRNRTLVEAIKKATKYRKRAEKDETFLKRPPFGLILSTDMEPGVQNWYASFRWRNWLTSAEKTALGRFPDIILTHTNIVRHQALVFRFRGDWQDQLLVWDCANTHL